jgi:MFS family permease
VLLATVLGSGIAFLDATVVNVALPTIGEQLDAGISSLQWMVNAYTLTLSGFLLLGGSLGDHYGRRRIFVTGVVSDRGPAIGAWSGLGGVTAAIGPFLGGWLVQAASWRLIFLINLPLAALVVWVALRHVPESRDPEAAPGLDYPARRWPRPGWPGWSTRSPTGRRPAGRPRGSRWPASPGWSPWSPSCCGSDAAATRCCRWISSPRASSPPPTWSPSWSTGRLAGRCS